MRRYALQFLVLHSAFFACKAKDAEKTSQEGDVVAEFGNFGFLTASDFKPDPKDLSSIDKETLKVYIGRILKDYVLVSSGLSSGEIEKCGPWLDAFRAKTPELSGAALHVDVSDVDVTSCVGAKATARSYFRMRCFDQASQLRGKKSEQLEKAFTFSGDSTFCNEHSSSFIINRMISGNETTKFAVFTSYGNPCVRTVTNNSISISDCSIYRIEQLASGKKISMRGDLKNVLFKKDAPSPYEGSKSELKVNDRIVQVTWIGANTFSWTFLEGNETIRGESKF